ncbi:MAG TPA: FAD-binding oxidoreductase [Steroidobacteraceae bacterium]|jgi:gamma-glutamylputrescine oxidase
MLTAPFPDYVDSYYAASTPLPPRAASLTGTVRADICVVGGGIAGCSAALALAERRYRVVLLEGQRIGWGASGRNGGQAIFGTAMEQSDLEQLVGAADARRIWEISLEGIALMKHRIKRHQIDCDWVDGQMFAAIKPRQLRALRLWQEQLEREYGYSSLLLMERAQVRSILATERYVGALHDYNNGHLHPLRYTLGLARAATQAGVEIYEGSRALSFARRDGLIRVRTDVGAVDCEHVLLAGNAWLGDTAPPLKRKLMTIGSYIIATEPLGERRARQLIANGSSVCDTNWILDYFRCTADYRLLFGGRVNYSLLNVPGVAQITRKRMLNVFPQLLSARIDYAWGCLLDITLNRGPNFGRLEPNVYYLQGFSGHGIALAGIAGQLVAESIAGTAERFDVFARIPHRDFPGGMALRRPTLVLAMLWYRLRDLL